MVPEGREESSLKNQPHESDRVAITGYGAVTPLGFDEGTIVATLRACQTGVSRQTIDGELDCHFGRVPAAIFDQRDAAFGFLRGDEQELARNDEGLLFAVVAANQAVAMAGLDRAPLPGHRVGVAVSSSKGLLRNMIRANRIFLSEGPCGPNRRLMTDLFLNFSGDTLGRFVSRKHGFAGPILNFPTACASGATSLIGAISLLRSGAVDAVLAGSSESSGNAVTIASFQNMGALSPDRIRPFHRERSGFNPGEGAAVFVVEREADARRRGARVVATIEGWDYRSDAYHITAVETDGLVVEHTIREALRRAGWRPQDVDYVNAHGTGTPLNDATEGMVVNRVFGEPGPLVSSLKGYVGHLLGGSASAELAMCLASLGDGFVPPTLCLDTPDPAIRLRHVAQGGEERRVGRFLKFSLGFGGHIAVLAVQLA